MTEILINYQKNFHQKININDDIFLTIFKIWRQNYLFELQMLTFDEKFICIHNAQTQEHFIIKTELQFQTFYSHLVEGNSCPQTNSTKKDISPKLSQGTQEIQKSRDPSVKIQQQYLEVKAINFKYLFQKLGIYDQTNFKTQIYVPQLDRYCQFQQLCDHDYCVPIQYTTNQVILLRYTKGFQINTKNGFKSMNQKKSNHAKQQIKLGLLSQNSLEKKQTNQSYGHRKSIDQIYHSPESFKDYRTDKSLMKQKNQQQFINTEHHQEAKQRDRSRSIGQIMQYVRKWRYIADQGINGAKFNLQEAAVYVGIPKKSLDDYFYQLRVGEKYDFDFQANSQRNISFLRRFVKQKVPSRNKQKDKEANKVYYQQSEKQAEQKRNDNSKDQTNKLQKLPKRLKEYKKNTKVDQNKSLNQHDIMDRRQHRLTDSQASSIPIIWPVASGQLKDAIFDDEDSFFNDFKCGNQNFLQYNHLLKNQEMEKDKVQFKEDSLSENSVRNSLLDYGLAHCFFKQNSENENEQNI